MELEQFKEAWNNESTGSPELVNSDIMELIQHKSYSPVATLKRKFRLQLLSFPLLVAVIVYDFIKKPLLLTDLTFWLFILFCFSVTGFFWFNYSIINRLQNSGDSVKAAITKDIIILEKGFKKFFIVSRIVFVLFIILVEVLMHSHKLPDFEIWSTYSIPIRITGYILALIVQYFLVKFSFKKQYGQHISFLKDLLQKAA